jgi:hypothetical protein
MSELISVLPGTSWESQLVCLDPCWPFAGPTIWCLSWKSQQVCLDPCWPSEGSCCWAYPFAAKTNRYPYVPGASWESQQVCLGPFWPAAVSSCWSAAAAHCCPPRSTPDWGVRKIYTKMAQWIKQVPKTRIFIRINFEISGENLAHSVDDDSSFIQK